MGFGKNNGESSLALRGNLEQELILARFVQSSTPTTSERTGRFAHFSLQAVGWEDAEDDQRDKRTGIREGLGIWGASKDRSLTAGFSFRLLPPTPSSLPSIRPLGALPPSPFAWTFLPFPLNSDESAPGLTSPDARPAGDRHDRPRPPPLVSDLSSPSDLRSDAPPSDTTPRSERVEDSPSES